MVLVNREFGHNVTDTLNFPENADWLGLSCIDVPVDETPNVLRLTRTKPDVVRNTARSLTNVDVDLLATPAKLAP